ncbi:DUF1120 domain-containing protein [Dyella subtropica]|uniref:DUF1120 domain-containing protein n=1 Tax=Dyella subtropica TaxID=2992127 RepID=UPI00224F9BEA|nr:DUF1120 domain-containing protein [Dyella subtropica]
MKTKLLAAAIAVTGLVALAPTTYAQSIDVKVIGTITPSVCTPSIAGGGVVDYGTIPAATLNQTAFNVLPEKGVAFTITCPDGPAHVGVTVVDNESSSMVAGITAAIAAGFTDGYNYGLGTVSGANVGGYVMRMKQGSFTVDGTATPTISSNDSGTTWLSSTSGGMGHFAGSMVSWGTTPAAGPTMGALFSGTLGVQAVLNKGSALPLTADVPLAGSATMTLVYL